MSTQIDQDVKIMQELLSKKEYQAVYDRYTGLLQEMLFVQSFEEWQDFIRQEGTLEEEPLRLYLSSRQGACLLLGCYEGDVTRKVLDYLKDRIPQELLEKLSGAAPIVIDIDEPDGTLEKQIAPYQKILSQGGVPLHIEFEDIYCAGAYFLSIETP